MQTITVHQEPSTIVLGIAFVPTLYADKGADHPTPPAPDRGQTGNKPKPEPDPKTSKKK